MVPPCHLWKLNPEQDGEELLIVEIGAPDIEMGCNGTFQGIPYGK